MKYQAKPVIVDAFKIVEVEHTPDGDPPLARDVKLEGREVPVRATEAMCARMIPKVGDYWVIQSDGYAYLNPKDVFERKYEPIPE